jgi:hypothetical protein
VPFSELRAPPAADLGAAGWVIRRPLVPMARVALLSVACEGEPAARHQVRPRPHLIVAGPNPASLRRCGRCARRGYPTDHRREPARARVLLRQGLYRLTDTVQTKERTPTFDLRAGAVIDGSDGGFIGISRPDGQGGLGAKILGGVFQHFGNEAAPSWSIRSSCVTTASSMEPTCLGPMRGHLSRFLT